MTTTTTTTKKARVLMWTIQALLAALFLFAGLMKLSMPTEVLAEQAQMSGTFLKVIGTLEVFGAVGLVLPSLVRILPMLTPVAAAGLVVIMVGATITSAQAAGAVAAILPLVVGILCGFVAYGRSRVARVVAHV